MYLHLSTTRSEVLILVPGQRDAYSPVDLQVYPHATRAQQRTRLAAYSSVVKSQSRPRLGWLGKSESALICDMGVGGRALRHTRSANSRDSMAKAPQ